MKIETDIWTVEKGELKEIKFNDEIFTVSKKKQETKQATLDQFGMFMTTKPVEQVTKMLKEKKEKSKGKPQGKKIGTYGTNAIHLNTYNDVKKWLDEGLSRYEIGAKIMQEYKPSSKIESCNALASWYIRYIQGIKPKQKKGLDKGKKAGIMKGNTMYINPFTDVKKALNEGRSWSYIRDNIIKKYYPNYNIYSLNTMASMYKKFALDKWKILND